MLVACLKIDVFPSEPMVANEQLQHPHHLHHIHHLYWKQTRENLKLRERHIVELQLHLVTSLTFDPALAVVVTTKNFSKQLCTWKIPGKLVRFSLWATAADSRSLSSPLSSLSQSSLDCTFIFPFYIASSSIHSSLPASYSREKRCIVREENYDGSSIIATAGLYGQQSQRWESLWRDRNVCVNFVSHGGRQVGVFPKLVGNLHQQDWTGPIWILLCRAKRYGKMLLLSCGDRTMGTERQCPLGTPEMVSILSTATQATNKQCSDRFKLPRPAPGAQLRYMWY